MKRKFGFITRTGVAVAALVLARPLLASPFPQTSQGSVIFTVDGAMFRADSQSVRQEVYYSFPAASLTYLPGKLGGYRAVYTTEVVLRDSTGTPRGTNSWRSENTISSVGEAREQQLTVSNQVEFQLAPGSWQLAVTIRDSASGRAGVAQIPFRVSAFPIRELAISDLEFATEIRPDTTSSIFTKNTYRVIPRVNRLYGGRISEGSLPVLNWYCEIYNLKPLSASGAKGTFRLDYTVLDSSGKAVQEVPGEVREKPGTSVVEVGAMNVAGLKAGKYHLVLKVHDLDSQSEAVREGIFEKLPLELVKASPVSAGSGAKLYYDQIQYLTIPDTVKFYKGLSPEGKKQFLEEFWKRHDLNVFAANMKYVEEHFSSGFKKGPQTDRGRVFLKYGKPDEVVPHPADEQYPPHEIWFYYGQGGKQFVFSDLSGYGKFELVYSSVTGESSNPRWQTLFDPSDLHK